MSGQTRFTLRIDNKVLDKVKASAEENKRSVAKEIEHILEEHFKNKS